MTKPILTCYNKRVKRVKGIKTKRCWKCKRSLPLDYFFKGMSWCKDCHNQWREEYLQRPGIRKRIAEQSKRHRQKNPYGVWIRGTLRDHRKRNFEVDITIGELAQLAKKTKECRYCGEKIIFKCGERGGKVKKDSPSLDRINNGNKLNINNVQIICFECNSTKRSRTHKEFIEWCRNILSRNDQNTLLKGNKDDI